MKDRIFYGIVIVVLVWFVASTIEVQIHNLDKDYVYAKANLWAIVTTHKVDMKVVDCEVCKSDDTFIVTLQDIEGNQYQYYDTEFQYNNWIKTVTMQGNTITEVKIKER